MKAIEGATEWSISQAATRAGIAVGSTAVVTQPRLGTGRWTVTECTPLRSFTWVASRPGITTSGIHLIEPTASGVKVTLSIEHCGPLAAVVAMLTSSTTRRYIHMEAVGLKGQSEKV